MTSRLREIDLILHYDTDFRKAFVRLLQLSRFDAEALAAGAAGMAASLSFRVETRLGAGQRLRSRGTFQMTPAQLRTTRKIIFRYGLTALIVSV